jgi:glycerol kinase
MSDLQRTTSMKRLQKQLNVNENHPQPPTDGPPLHAPTPLRHTASGGTGTPTSSQPTPNPFSFGAFTAIDDESPSNSPFSSTPASRRGSFAHPSHSGPRPAIPRRRDSANWQEGAVDITGAPSLLSRAGSPTLPLMTLKTRSAASSVVPSRRGSFVGQGTPLGQGLGMSDLMTGREKKKGEFVGSVDCGTTSTRFIVFDQYAKIICEHQMEFKQYYPHPG